MAKPKGSKKVSCRNGHDNYIVPGTVRQCSETTCRCSVKLAGKRAKTRVKGKVAA